MKNLKDYYYNKAKKEGYPARSIYKLQQIDNKHNLINRGDIILELGAAPGSWTKYILKKIENTGKLIAVDIKKINANAQNLIFINNDIHSLDFINEIEKINFDLILSDIAPNTTGIKIVDQENSFNISNYIIDLANKVLKINGSLIIKTFQGSRTPYLILKLKKLFKQVITEKPSSSRKESFELFLTAKYLIKQNS